MSYGALTVLLARAHAACEVARREAEREGAAEKYELGYAQRWLALAVTRHREANRIEPEAFQAQVDLARRGFEGMAS